MARPITSPARGRPPDPELEQRVLSAALDVYAATGWTGFTLDAVARRARVGKASLYNRWTSKEHLIVDAIRTISRIDRPQITGPLPVDLLALAETLLGSYLGPLGLARLRAQMEAKVYPELFGAAMELIRTRWIREGRKIVLNAIDRGEIPLDTSPAMVMDALAGIIQNRILNLPTGRLEQFHKERHDYAERVVGFVLAAVKYAPDSE